METICRSYPESGGEKVLEEFNENTSLTAEQAAELVAKQKGVANLDLYGLTSINKDVAQELAKFKGG